MRPAKAIGFATAAAAGLLASGPAWADAHVGAIAGVRGGYSTNPYSAGGGDAGSGTITGSFSPTVVLAAPTGSTRIDGNIDHTEFSQRYKGATNYSIGARTEQKVTPTITLTGGGGFSSQFSNALFANLIPNQPGGPDDPIVVDPTGAATYGRRINSWNANLGMSVMLTPRDSLSVNGEGSQVDYGKAVGDLTRNYDTVAGGLSYMRVLNQTTSLGLGVNVARSNYHEERFGDGTQISPSVILDTRFSPRLSLNLSLGLTFSDTKLYVGSARRTSFSGSVRLCNAGERSNICLNGARSIAPTAFSGLSTLTSLGLSYRYQLSAQDSINASAGYSNSKRIYGAFSEDYDYATATVGYDRRLGERLSGVISVTYSDAYSSFVNRPANVWGTIGIRYRLGDI